MTHTFDSGGFFTFLVALARGVPLCSERDFAAAAPPRRGAASWRWGNALAALQKFSTRLAQFREKALAAPSVSKTLFFARLF